MFAAQRSDGREETDGPGDELMIQVIVLPKGLALKGWTHKTKPVPLFDDA